MSFLSWLFGKQGENLTFIQPLQDVIPANKNQMDSNETGGLTFYVDGLQNEFKEFSRVGESVKLWIPKVNPDKVYIYHRDGPGGCLGIVPSHYSRNIISHLLDASDYEAVIEELTDNMCKIKCRLSSKEETTHRKAKEKESLRTELTKPYNPKKPISLMIAVKGKKTVKVGEKLVIEFDDLGSYIQNAGYKNEACQWQIKFFNQACDTVGIFENDKSPIQRILKAHFNSFLFDVEVLDIAKERNIAWKGYLTKLVITPYKSNNTASN